MRALLSNGKELCVAFGRHDSELLEACDNTDKGMWVDI